VQQFQSQLILPIQLHHIRVLCCARWSVLHGAGCPLRWGRGWGWGREWVGGDGVCGLFSSVGRIKDSESAIRDQRINQANPHPH
jgi:hypothetical protein